ncbi:hypothetical protein AALP_AA4G101100 [Arabis alpina]|uniref:DUF4283 domain-containing protein n=1 Tax=Arabis alpina TaxID=50452 RepID=A0A087H2C1_ARAAL|nr:hypothetical protein AALP_AA4G101100 [Arabis alpina]
MSSLFGSKVNSGKAVEIPSPPRALEAQNNQLIVPPTVLVSNSATDLVDVSTKSDSVKIYSVKAVNTAEPEIPKIAQACAALQKPNPSINSTGNIDPPPVTTKPGQDTKKAEVHASSESWVNLVKGSAKPLKKKGTPFLLESGEACIKISNEVIERNRKSWDCFILGQFYSDPPSQGKIHNIVNGIWSRQMRDVAVSKMEGNAFLFRIPNIFTRNRVLNQRLWQIEGQTMFVAKWEPGVVPVKPELTSAPIWLELRDFPLQFFHEEGLERIACLVGDPKFLHPSTANKTNLEVAKVFTLIDPRKPLPEAVNVQFESGDIRRIRVSSPWMPPICSHCMEIGHSLRHCKRAPITCNLCSARTHDDSKCPKGNPVRPKPKRHQRRRRSKTPTSIRTPPESYPSGSVALAKEWAVKGKSLEIANTNPVGIISTSLVKESGMVLPLPGEVSGTMLGNPSSSKSQYVPSVSSDDAIDSEVEGDSSDINSSEYEEDSILDKLSAKQQKGLRGKGLKPNF